MSWLREIRYAKDMSQTDVSIAAKIPPLQIVRNLHGYIRFEIISLHNRERAQCQLM